MARKNLKKKELEEEMAAALRARNVPFEREVQFIKDRKWRMDFMVPPGPNMRRAFGIEVNGGVWLGGKGRHLHPKGAMADGEKFNAAVSIGVCVLVCWPAPDSPCGIEKVATQAEALYFGELLWKPDGG